MQEPSMLQKLLIDTLNPSLTNEAHSQLQNIRGRQDFAKSLLVIADKQQTNINIRQSALVTLKNLVFDQCKSQSNGVMNRNDWETVKSSILQAFIRSCGQTKLTPTFRQIIFKIAQRDFPENWNYILPNILDNFSKLNDLPRVYASIQALKAIVSIYGRNLMKELSLNNICNKIMIPLNNLAAYFFKNFIPQSALILQSIFKILSTVMYFHLPEILAINIHSWMVFIKKVLDFNYNGQSQQICQSFCNLKRICLKILFTIYSKHVNKSIKTNNFIDKFHQTFSKGILESLIYQIFSDYPKDKDKKLYMTSLALSCFPYLYNDDQNCASIIINYIQKIISLCVSLYTLPLNFSTSEVSQVVNYLREQRSKFIDFIKIFFGEKQHELNITNQILQFILQKIQKGSDQQKQITLYIFAQIRTQIKYIPQIHDKMIQALLSCVIPQMDKYKNFKNLSDMVINARICQIIHSYEFLVFPENSLQSICIKVTNCLFSKVNSYLNVYACQAFTALLKYQPIIKLAVPSLKQILQNYMNLMDDVDLNEVMQSMQEMLQKFEDYLGPYAQDFVKCLISNFYKSHQSKQNDSTNFTTSQQEQDEDFDENDEQSQSGYENTQKGCLAAVRQILLANLPQESYKDLQDDLFNLIVYIMRDRKQAFLEEGFNLLNIILFKTNGQNISQKFFYLFSVLIYSLTGIPPQLIQLFQSQKINVPIEFQQIISNVCVDVDSDIIQNVIGSLRNMISKLGCVNNGAALRNRTDYLGNKYMNMAIGTAQCIHRSQKTKLSDKSIILTIDITLIEYQCLDAGENELGRVLTLCLQQIGNQQNSNNRCNFTPLYLQIICLGIYYYPEYFLKYLNVDYIVGKIMNFWHRFTNDFDRQRIILGIGKMIQTGVLQNSNSHQAQQLIKLLPQFLEKQCLDRNTEGQFCNKSESDEAIDEQQENTHMLGKETILNIKNDEESCSQQQWGTQFNKLYLSPSEKVQEMGYIGEVLKNQGMDYIKLLTNQQQLKLSNAITNVKPRN